MRRLGTVILGAMVIAMLMSSGATAGSGGPDLSANACGGGKLVINVTLRSINNYDSGVHGNAWANDTINRHIQVWQVGNDLFCAVVSDEGSFITFAGDSPGGVVGGLTAGIKGTISGGYRRSFTGTVDSSTTYSMKGNLGTVDYACTDAYTCPGAIDWQATYFNEVGSDSVSPWAWQYKTPRNGSWVNAEAGNSGDITG